MHALVWMLVLKPDPHPPHTHGQNGQTTGPSRGPLTNRMGQVLEAFPPPCPSPAVVLPQGGGGGHLLNPKIFVAAHCVVVAKPPPKSAAQSIPVESGEHVQEFKVKWSRTKKIYTELVKE